MDHRSDGHQSHVESLSSQDDQHCAKVTGDETYAGGALDAWFFASNEWAIAPYAEARYYLGSGEVNLFLGVRFQFSRGRVFRDLMPGTVSFDEDRGYLYPEPRPGLAGASQATDGGRPQ